MKIKVGSYADVKQPEMSKDKAFCCIYSPKSFTLWPKDNILLDLKKVNVSETLEPWINLLPYLKDHGLKIQEHNWTSNKLKDDTIQLNILNRNFTRTTHIKKDQETAYMLLLGQKFNDIIVTEYNIIT